MHSHIHNSTASTIPTMATILQVLLSTQVSQLLKDSAVEDKERFEKMEDGHNAVIWSTRSDLPLWCMVMQVKTHGFSVV